MRQLLLLLVIEHGVQLWCMSRATSTGSGTLFVRSAFLVSLPDASESCFFFPMVRASPAARRKRSVRPLWS
jgi:hypothetical protein